MLYFFGRCIQKRLQHMNTAGIGGIGIWALGYDDGYSELWNAISDFMTECYTDSCSGMIHDFGGPYKIIITMKIIHGPLLHPMQQVLIFHFRHLAWKIIMIICTSMMAHLPHLR